MCAICVARKTTDKLRAEEFSNKCAAVDISFRPGGGTGAKRGGMAPPLTDD
jgi:hypothetical protein